MTELSEKRNRRALITGVVFVVSILLFHFVISPGMDQWKELKLELADTQRKLELVGAIDNLELSAKRKELAQSVPAFEMPQREDKQRLLFERKINEQLQKAGIKLTNQPQYYSKGKKQPGLGLKLLRLQCRGNANFSQIMDLLAGLNENPYLVSIEEIKIECGKKKREEMSLSLTLSTFVR